MQFKELIDLNRTNGKLYAGDELVPSGVGNTLVIPKFTDPAVMSMYNEVMKIPAETELKRAQIITDYIHKFFYYDYDWMESVTGKTVDLAAQIQDRRGVCKELAAATQMLFQMANIDSRYKRGPYMGYGHAWIKVNSGGSEHLADPTEDRFGNYQKLKELYGYKEGTNYVRRIPQ